MKLRKIVRYAGMAAVAFGMIAALSSWPLEICVAVGFGGVILLDLAASGQ